jgi:glycosyltransferase involved in cell wall biosynthesis
MSANAPSKITGLHETSSLEQVRSSKFPPNTPPQLFFDGTPIALDQLRPPLVSLVIVNWNYKDYVGDAIRSVRQQDYSLFECIVVDNASNDGSIDVIKRSIDDDPRFSLVRLPENVGQLNAVLHVVDRLRGGFVVFVDADDALLPNFLSSHLQVHLAMPSSVGLTSSDVLQVDSAGQVLTGCRDSFGYDCPTIRTELRQSSETLRLSTVSDTHFQALARRVARIDPDKNSWVWAPGTANMFRKSVLDLVLPDPVDRASHAGCDNYFIPFVHFLAGSALIFQPLSFYRFHDYNAFSAAPPVGGLALTRSAAQDRADQRRQEIVRTLMRKAGEFKLLLSQARYWQTLDLAASIGEQTRRQFFRKAEVQAIILENHRHLDEAFGARTVISELWSRMSSRHWWRLVRIAYADRLPPPRLISILALSMPRLAARFFARRLKSRLKTFATRSGP